jgi:hypothetical protein
MAATTAKNPANRPLPTTALPELDADAAVPDEVAIALLEFEVE